MGNDIASAFDGHYIADPDVLSVDVLLVVEGCISDCGAANRHRLQYGVWIKAAGAADIYPDFQQSGDGLFRWEFVGDGPARLPASHSQSRLQGQRRDLYYHSVGLVGQSVTCFNPIVVLIYELLEVVA